LTPSKTSAYALHHGTSSHLKHSCSSTVGINCFKSPCITMVAYNDISAHESEKIIVANSPNVNAPRWLGLKCSIVDKFDITMFHSGQTWSMKSADYKNINGSDRSAHGMHMRKSKCSVFCNLFPRPQSPKTMQNCRQQKSGYLSGSSFPSITANTFSMVAKVSFPCRWDSIIIEASFGLQDSQNVGIGKT
jgi:hypothetical protein